MHAAVLIFIEAAVQPTTFSLMKICRRSSRLIFNGFRRYSSKNPIQESISRARLHSFSSRRPILGEFGVKKKQRKSSFLDGAKNFYSVDSNNEVYVFARSRVWRRWAWNVENAVAMALFSGGVALVVFFGKWETMPYTKTNHLVISPAFIFEVFGENTCERLKKEFENLVVPPLDPDCVRARKIAGDLVEGFRRRSREEKWPLQRLQGWEVVLLDVPRETITSFPGGKIFICTDLLYSLGEDAQLATYIARQLGHSVGRHVERLVMLKLILSIFLLILHLFLMHAPTFNSMPCLVKFLRFPFTRSVVYGITWMAVSRHLHNFYLLKFEREADYIGLLLVASAGYDPRVALQVREMIARIRGNTRWEKMRTKLLALDMDEALSIHREVQASSTK